MSPELIFAVANKVAILGWIVLALTPRKTARLLSGVAIPAALGLSYAVLLALHFGSVEGGFGSLEDVVKLFSDRWMVLIGWIHYLAFDLFIGAWQSRDAQKHGISHLLVLPCLFFTLMFGPVGLLLYLALRAVKTHQLALE